MRYLTAGESHGQALVTIIEGIPANLPITADDINRDLTRRQKGYGRGGRMAIETDRVEILSGIRNGVTLGSPITLLIKNKDWTNWEEIMSPLPGAEIEQKKISRPRPGHADLSGCIKYEQQDMRNILERSSARETAARVAAGAVAKRLLQEVNIRVAGHVVGIGDILYRQNQPQLTLEEILAAVKDSPVRCIDQEISQNMISAIERAKDQGDSLGGIFEIIVDGVCPGLGSHVQWDRKLDGRLAGALMSIQGIKGVEIGLGFLSARLPGSKVHDEIFFKSNIGLYRETNRAGGIEGGMTNGEPIIIRAAMKPIPTLMKPLSTVNLESKESCLAQVERSDVCAVPAACVVGEAVTAWEIAQAMEEKFGGDTIREFQERVGKYKKYVKQV
ncbi:MAG: chorismate synthase [Bacillota bacterium]|jgi:chorismate synthase